MLSEKFQVIDFDSKLYHVIFSLLRLLAYIVSFEQSLCHVASSSAISLPANMLPCRLLIPWYPADLDSASLWTRIKKLPWPEECFNKSSI